MTDVRFHFDVMCPWAYQTYKWVEAAATQRDINVTLHFFSLEERNWKAGQKHPWERPWSFGWSLLRIAAWLERHRGGNQAVSDFYVVAGRMLHEEGTAVQTPQGAREVLRAMNISPDIADEALNSDWTNDRVRDAHRAAVDLGVHGVPTLLIDDEHLLFGPVITPAPLGQAAAELWDLVGAWTRTPHLYKLQRVKTDAEQQHIVRSFEPFRIARESATREVLGR
ncbi:hypothetical protein A5685_15750 [Mycobacterium colombiense]|uniref:Uncharacterized protein n=1 Tax=Mycobacterium colombiense TaxID=339268 RepID=A0A1A2RJ98_9MYCO|nr:DsbA family protein [Mycobacterium colombiense]OBH51770.1 hypothetical protein A5685_15750 [Mycobacterium colombiense]